MNSDYDYNIIIKDRIQQVGEEITKYLKSTDRMAKTIVFCATEDVAFRMRNTLVCLQILTGMARLRWMKTTI